MAREKKGAPEKSSTQAKPLRSDCPVTNTLDIMGDRWTLLIIRDMLFMGKKRYGEFAESTERIPTNILAERLRRLEGEGLITKAPYQHNPVRHEYTPTQKARELAPVLIEIVRWAGNHLPHAHKASPEQIEALLKQAMSGRFRGP